MMARLRTTSAMRTLEVLHEYAEAHQSAKVASGVGWGPPECFDGYKG